MNTVFSLLAAIAGVAVLVALSVFWFSCPCERTPGGPVRGELVSVPVNDWSFANEVPLCQMQVNGVVPWSVNLNCMADQGALYISCARCEGKYWSGRALADPQGNIKIGAKVYPVMLRRVMDAAELDRAWAARANKTGRGRDRARDPLWWSFALTSVAQTAAN